MYQTKKTEPNRAEQVSGSTDPGSTCPCRELSIYLTPLTSGGFLVYVISLLLPVARPRLAALGHSFFSPPSLIHFAVSLFPSRRPFRRRNRPLATLQLTCREIGSIRRKTDSSAQPVNLCPHNTNKAAMMTAFLFRLLPILGCSENK